MATFIKITDLDDGCVRTVRVGAINQYLQHNGKTLIDISDGVIAIRETPEQIDAMLGVTESGEAIAAALEAEADRMDDDATAIHNMSMRSDMKLRAKAFRDAAKIARAARGE